MVHIIIKTSKAKALYDRDQLVSKATKESKLVSYSDEQVETTTDKYIFRIMPVAMPAELINQILDLGNVEGDADVTDIINTLEADIAKIKAAISQVVKPAEVPVAPQGAQIGIDPAATGADKTVSSELPTFTGNKLETEGLDQGPVKIETLEDQATTSPDAQNATQGTSPADTEGNTAGNPNPQA